jgi:3-dehydroquinate synthase
MILQGLEEFREHLGGDLTITLLRSIGKGLEAHEVNEVEMFAAIRELQARHNERALRGGVGQSNPDALTRR